MYLACHDNPACGRARCGLRRRLALARWDDESRVAALGCHGHSVAGSRVLFSDGQRHNKACFVCDEDATLELKVKTVHYFKGLMVSAECPHCTRGTAVELSRWGRPGLHA